MSGDPRLNRRVLDGLMVAGSAVILTGDAAEVARQAVASARRSRRVNGLPDTPAYQLLAESLTQVVSAAGRTDVREPAAGQHFPYEPPTVPLELAAQRLGVGHRQARRLAPLLGGRKIGGRWFIDEHALTEHLDGKEAI